MEKIGQRLEAIAVAVEKNLDEAAVKAVIRTVREQIRNNSETLLKELDLELVTWESKLFVILQEPVGRKGMARHARFWAERLKKTSASF